MHIHRWDLDKTYLATEIESIRGLLRAAIEPASQKRNVPGAPALLRGLIAWDPSCRVAIVSGSPTQMRGVLEEKLAIDGVRFDSLVLKDNLGNLRRGRLRAVRGQLGYKLPQLLRQRAGLGPESRETLFGDDAEVDALIYTLYADAIAGRVDAAELGRVMIAGGAYPDTVEDATQALRQITPSDAVEDIFIVLGRATPVRRFWTLGSRVIPIFSWLQAAIVLWDRGRLGPRAVLEVARACAEAGLSEAGTIGLVQDAVRRGLVSAERVRAVADDTEGLGGISDRVARALARLGPAPPLRKPDAPAYLSFLHERT